jgi:hypothetical protein
MEVHKVELIENWELCKRGELPKEIEPLDDLNQPVFQPLKDLNYFRSFKLNSWTIEWENGADFAPEFLYDRVKSSILVK